MSTNEKSIRCPECGHETTPIAGSCSNCGYPLKQNDTNSNKETNDFFTVICPNKLCGKEVSTKFDNCPFCNTPLIKPKRTAEDIINEHKHKEELVKEQNEEILKEAVRKRYNVVGDISDEQYKQLIEIYKDEVGDAVLNDERKDKGEKHSKKSKGDWIVGVGMMVSVIAVIILICSIGGSHQTKKNLCGTWLYTGGRYASVTFEEDGTFHTGGFLDSKGRYEINGKEINIYYSHGTSTTLKLADDNNLYAPDGSHYVKISQEEQDKLNRVNEELFKIQEANRALQYMYEYNARYNNHLF